MNFSCHSVLFIYLIRHGYHYYIAITSVHFKRPSNTFISSICSAFQFMQLSCSWPVLNLTLVHLSGFSCSGEAFGQDIYCGTSHMTKGREGGGQHGMQRFFFSGRGRWQMHSFFSSKKPRFLLHTPILQGKRGRINNYLCSVNLSNTKLKLHCDMFCKYIFSIILGKT